MARLLATATVLLALVLGCYAAPGDPAPTYECDEAACAETDGCLCASLTNPGGFAVAKTPQFVLLTFDDSVLPETMQLIEGVLAAGHKSANTCPVKLTFYTTAQVRRAQLPCTQVTRRGRAQHLTRSVLHTHTWPPVPAHALQPGAQPVGARPRDRRPH